MTNQHITHHFHTTDEGNPSGGSTEGIGIDIKYQDGPMVDDEQNGAVITDLIAIAIKRLEFYNDSKFRCRENSVAITKLEEAKMWLEKRLNRREENQTLNTYKTDSTEG